MNDPFRGLDILLTDVAPPEEVERLNQSTKCPMCGGPCSIGELEAAEMCVNCYFEIVGDDK